MKTHKIAIKWKRLSAAMMIVLTLMSLGISAYADPVDPPVVADESEVVGIGAESTVVVCTAEVNESEIVGIGAEQTGAETEPPAGICTVEVNESEIVGIGAESRSGSTTAREKDVVPDTGEVSYNMVLLPIFLFGVAGMVVFGRKSCLYEGA